jgi:biotin carboxyl carrier protein
MTEPTVAAPDAATPDPARAVRVAVARPGRREGDPTIIASPPKGTLLVGVDHVAGVEPDDSSMVFVDGERLQGTLRELGGGHARLTIDGSEPVSMRLVLGEARRRGVDGILVREVVVGGWRVEVEVEPEQRAALRERAHRARVEKGAGGPVEVHAIIPGRIVAVSVAAGDAVTAGQQVLVLEAMKMQNELRAPREGTIERMAVGVGENVEVGDLLVVIR